MHRNSKQKHRQYRDDKIVASAAAKLREEALRPDACAISFLRASLKSENAAISGDVKVSPNVELWLVGEARAYRNGGGGISANQQRHMAVRLKMAAIVSTLGNCAGIIAAKQSMPIP